MTSRPLVAILAALTLTGTALAGSAVSTAAHAPKADPQVATVAKGLVGPLSVAQAPDGTRYWADTFAGVLYKQAVDGTVSVIYKSKKSAPEGVSADGGVLRFATGSNDNKAGKVWTLDTAGAPVLIGDTYKHEKKDNPDGKVTYGFINTPECLKKLPKQIPANYPGSRRATRTPRPPLAGSRTSRMPAPTPSSRSRPTGVITTVAPITPAESRSQNGRRGLGPPACTVGKRYAFESVPTDIEVGTNGFLYVTSLPGGPEDGSLGFNGRVLKVKIANGKVSKVAGGLLSPTGLALASNGDIYVSQLFLGVISKIKAGTSKVKPYVELPLPAAVEATPTGLLATINALPGKKPKGKVVTITP